MTSFQVHTETPEATERRQCNKTWTTLIKDIKKENKVFKWFWSERNVAQRLWKEKEKKMSETGMTMLFEFDPAHLATVYRSLLGGKMNYQMGDLGPHLDIFFVCVLMNQRELAFELWKQCEVPVCAAICAVRLLLCLPQQRART